MASKQPRRSHLTSDLKFMAQIAYTTMFGLFGPSFELREKEDERKNPLISTRVVGFAATKKFVYWQIVVQK